VSQAGKLKIALGFYTRTDPPSHDVDRQSSIDSGTVTTHQMGDELRGAYLTGGREDRTKKRRAAHAHMREDVSQAAPEIRAGQVISAEAPP